MVFDTGIYKTSEKDFIEKINKTNCTKSTQKLKDLFLSIIKKAKLSKFDMLFNERSEDTTFYSDTQKEGSIFTVKIFDKKSIKFEQKFNEILDFYKHINTNISTDIHEYFCNYVISFVCFNEENSNKSYFSCTFDVEYPHYDNKKNDKFVLVSFRKSKKIYMYESMVPYCQYQNNNISRSYPANLKQLFSMFAIIPENIAKLKNNNYITNEWQNIPYNNTRFDILDAFLEFYSKNNFAFKDILCDYRNGCFIMPPINFDIILSSHNKKDIIKAKIKNANVTSKDNILPLTQSYYLHKAKKYIDSDYFQKLYLMSTDNLFYALYESNKEKQRIINVFKAYYHDFIFKNTPSDEDIINDYIEMTIASKQKININLKSYKKLVEKHNEMALRIEEKNTPVIKIPDTALSKLNLPTEFKRITNKRQLVLEGQEQHNCVVSYARKINKGQCIIYTTIYENKRYTIEIQYRNRRFILAQCRGKFNELAPEKLEQIINNLLEKESIRLRKTKK